MSRTPPSRPRARRIGIFVSDFPIISETFVTTLAESLLESGHDLRILARDRPEQSDGPMHDYVRRSGLLERVSRSDEGRGRLGLGAVARLARAQPRKAPVLAALWALDRAVPRRTMAVTRHLAGLDPFDVVHAQFATLGETAQRHRDYGTLRARALVTHLRGFDITRHAREHGPNCYDRVFARGDLFIANCHHFREVAIGIGCPADRTIVIGSPCDTAYFSPPQTREPYAPGRELRLVAVGRLVEKKGFGDILEAMPLLAARGIRARLDLLGDGPLRDGLAERVEALGLGGRVTLHGAATQAQILAALHAAHIGLAPSVTAAAGDQDAPVNTLKEKMATGLPVVATRHGGIPELVKDGENGRLVPEHDPAAIAAAVADLARNSDDWSRMGARGRARVVETYDKITILKQTNDAYERALENAARSHTSRSPR